MSNKKWKIEGESFNRIKVITDAIDKHYEDANAKLDELKENTERIAHELKKSLWELIAEETDIDMEEAKRNKRETNMRFSDENADLGFFTVEQFDNKKDDDKFDISVLGVEDIPKEARGDIIRKLVRELTEEK